MFCCGDKCNRLCDPDNPSLHRVWPFTPLLLPQHLSLNFSGGVTLWPAPAHIMLFIPGTVPRWLWGMLNELSCKETVVPCHQHSSLLPVSASLSYLQPYPSCFLLSSGIFFGLESPGGVTSSSLDRYIICWDLHVIEESVQHTKYFSKDSSDTLYAHIIHRIWYTKFVCAQNNSLKCSGESNTRWI